MSTRSKAAPPPADSTAQRVREPESVVTITESDIQKAIPGAKAYWNTNGLPSGLGGKCCADFFDVADPERRYKCERPWGHSGACVALGKYLFPGGRSALHDARSER